MATLNPEIMEVDSAPAWTSRYHCFYSQPRPLHRHFLDGAMDPLMRGNAVVQALTRLRGIRYYYAGSISV